MGLDFIPVILKRGPCGSAWNELQALWPDQEQCRESIKKMSMHILLQIFPTQLVLFLTLLIHCIFFLLLFTTHLAHPICLLWTTSKKALKMNKNKTLKGSQVKEDTWIKAAVKLGWSLPITLHFLTFTGPQQRELGMNSPVLSESAPACWICGAVEGPSLPFPRRDRGRLQTLLPLVSPAQCTHQRGISPLPKQWGEKFRIYYLRIQANRN